ncbi:MFS transporter [Streptomyces sp. NPDC054863]
MSVHTSEQPAPGQTRVPVPPAPPTRGRGARAGVALGLLAGCNAMVLLDESMVQIALPGMSQDLGMSPVGLGWAMNSYLLAFGGLLLLGGRAGDLLGRRRVFLAGVALFTLAAALRATASSGDFLIAVRAVQGVGAALATPSALALVLSMFAEGAPRKRAIAVCTAVGAASTTGGLLLAGTLSSVSSWRWVLLLNVPVGLLILLLAPLVLKETPRARGQFDLLGALLSTLGATALVLGLARVAEHPWSDLTVVGPIALGALLFAVFVLVERRARQPVLVLRLFTDRNRVWAWAGTFAVQGALIGTGFFLVQFFPQFTDYGPLGTAFALSPIAVSMVVMSGVVVRLERAFGARRVMLAGALLLAAANLWLSRLSPEFDYATDVLAPLVVFGCGMACYVIPPMMLATSRLRSDEAGAASSVHNSLQTLGASLGIAILVTVASHAGRGAARGQEFVSGMQASFVAGACCAAAAFLAALFVRPTGGADAPVRDH